MIDTKDVTEKEYFPCYSRNVIEKAAGNKMVVGGLAEIYFEQAVIDIVIDIFEEGLNVDVARKYKRINKEENKGTEFHILFWPNIRGAGRIVLEFDLGDVISGFLDCSAIGEDDIDLDDEAISLAIKYRDEFVRLAKLIDTRLGNQTD